MTINSIITNGHLKPIFDQLLPEIEKASIDYWVYGGVSIAAFGGKFHRENKDVDVFVKDSDLKKVELLLSNLSEKNNYQYDYVDADRPKININIDGAERLSIIPMYQNKDVVIFKYRDGNQEYAEKILQRIERHLSSYKFFTPRDDIIKEMFIKYIKAKPKKAKRGKLKKDAEVILNFDERRQLGFYR